MISRVNKVRVWPKGNSGKLKKLRCLLKMLVKTSIFDNFMVLSVFLNTVVMGMAQYNMSVEMTKYTELAS